MMADDFGTPNLNIGAYSSVFAVNADNKLDLMMHRLELVRRWENLSHPYFIFNADKETFTFMGIYLHRKEYKFMNPNTNEILVNNELFIKPQLRIELMKEKVPIYDNFNDFSRIKKIKSMRSVMGLTDLTEIQSFDPDSTYELTLDNCLKMIAMYLRLKSTKSCIIMVCNVTCTFDFLSVKLRNYN